MTTICLPQTFAHPTSDAATDPDTRLRRTRRWLRCHWAAVRDHPGPTPTPSERALSEIEQIRQRRW